MHRPRPRSQTAPPLLSACRGFPKSICTSVNNVAVHGIPDDRPLEAGDMVKIDVTLYKDGFHGGSAGQAAARPRPLPMS